MDKLLDKAPKNCFAGQCSEINALARAMNKERSLDGAETATVHVRGSSSESGLHGAVKEACSVCAHVLDQLGL